MTNKEAIKCLIHCRDHGGCHGQYDCMGTNEVEDLLNLAIKALERPQGEWIPVSEKLPDDMQEVLVWFEYFRYGDYNCMYPTYGLCHVLDGKWSPFINGHTGWRDARIIAWCPIPEPYKETENEDSN